MKYQVLFSLKNNEKVFINVVCCSSDWRFKHKEYNIMKLLLYVFFMGFNMFMF